MLAKKKKSHWTGNKYALTHGKRRSPEYRVWTNMKQRCYNKNNHGYKNYGGRGVTICESWRTSFYSFYLDMGGIPSGKMLDRINNNEGYYKENCRWATRTEQNNNQRIRKDAKITPELCDAVLRLSKTIKTQREVARQLGTDYRVVNRILHSKTRFIQPT